MKYTNQSAFTTAAIHLLNQGKRCFSRAYAGCVLKKERPNGDSLHCAVGCLIPDAEYNARLEGMTVDSLSRSVSSLRGLDVDLLFDLVRLHDHSRPNEWEKELGQIAKRRGLDVEWEWVDA